MKDEKESSFAKATEDKEKKEKEPNKEPDIEELKKPAPDGRGSLNEIERQLEECQKLKDEYLAGWQRARADFINYQKEEMERIGELVKYASWGLMLKILPVLDNFELAEKNLPEDLKQNENVKGILQIKTQFQDFLKSQGVEEIKCMGEKFDPNFQEVVEVIEAKDKGSRMVIEETQKGYTINGRLLRPAKVKITK